MLPFILIVVAIGLLVGGAALKWDDIMIALKGKCIAVLGARGVGKTHLLKFLTTGSIPENYKQTVAPEKTKGRRFQLGDLDLKLKETIDISGDKAAYAEWKKLYDQADFVFYLLRADRLIEGDAEVEARVRDDLRHIGGWLETSKTRPPFFIIGTHCDLDPNFSKISLESMGDYLDNFRKLPIVSEIVIRGGGAVQTKVFLGSFKTVQETEALVFQIFNQVVS